MTALAAVAACAMLGGLAVFQLLLISGARLGRYAWGGQHEVLPRRLRIGSAVSIALYAVFALVILQRAGLVSLIPGPAARAGIWVLAAYFGLGIVLNAISRSKRERYAMVPTTAALGGLCLVIAMS
jgi:hypothetical protein